MGGDILCTYRNQKATDRPDLIVRVFRMKLKELLNDICNKHVLGKPLAHVYTIEIQKRGLPHAHILVIYVRARNLENHQIMTKLYVQKFPIQFLIPDYTILLSVV